jgi:hypothetical protein
MKRKEAKAKRRTWLKVQCEERLPLFKREFTWISPDGAIHFIFM